MSACCAVRGNVKCGRLLVGAPALVDLPRLDDLPLQSLLLDSQADQEAVLETQLGAVVLICRGLIRHVVERRFESISAQARAYCEVDFWRSVARELATATQDRPI